MRFTSSPSRTTWVSGARPSRIATVALAAMLTLAGCAIQEPRTVVETDTPAAWASASPAPASAGAAVPASDRLPVAGPTAGDVLPAQWWRGFGSTQLESLVDQALAGSSDLRTAAQRVRQADIALQLAGASQLPSVSGSVGSSASHAESSATRKTTSASLNVSYEVDLWGRLAAGSDSAQAAANASRYDLETARITLTSSVATTYFQLLALRERLEIARRSLATAERLLRIVEARLRYGTATPLEVSQQLTTVLQQRTALAPLESQARQTASALALLLGRQPVGFDAGEGERLTQLVAPVVGAGLPSQLLVRRPDLRAAEARLTAADADVAAARAALLPSLSLSMSGGTSSAALATLSGGAGTVSLAASLAQTIFDGGRKKLQVESTRSQREVLVETYASAVRRAFKEVDDALVNTDTNRRQEVTQGEVVAQAQRTLDLAERRYREGVDTLTTVLDAQRTLFNAQDALAQTRLARLTSAVDLYRVLGGGWQP